jgi:hypothetical protein
MLTGDTTFTGDFDTSTQLTLDGAYSLDITGAGSTNHPGSVVLMNGATIRLTAVQADALSISGTGSVVVSALSATDTSDFSSIDTALTIQLTAASNVDFNGTFDAAQPLTVTGAAELDIVGATNWPTSINLASNAVVRLSAAQASGLSVTGTGSVIVTNIHSTLDADLNGLLPSAGVTVALSANATLTSAATIANESLTVTGSYILNLSNVTSGNFGLGSNTLSIASGATVVVTKALIRPSTTWATIEGPGTLGLTDASLTAAELLSLDAATTAVVSSTYGVTTLALTGTAAEFTSLIAAVSAGTVVLPTNINVTVSDDATVAEMVAIDTMNGTGTLSYSLNDSSANLFAASTALRNGATNITASDAATAAQAVVIEGATNAGTTTYSITDTAANLVAIAGDVLNSATNIVVSDTVNLSDSVTIYNATNSGTTTYHISDAVTTLSSALGTPTQVLVMQAATSVTVVSGVTNGQIDLSGFSGSNVVNLTIIANNLANSIDGGDGNDIINAQSGNDVVYGGLGDDTINTGLGADIVILSTMLSLNGSDTVSDFSATDQVFFNFGDTSELVMADLRGNGTGYQAIAAGGTISADTGLVVITTTQGDLTATTARSLALGLVGESDSDQFYLVFSNGVSTAVYRMADTDTNVSNGFETAELLATLTGVTNPSASSAFFPDFV